MEKKSRKKLFFLIGFVVIIIVIVLLNRGKSSGYKFTVQTDKVERGNITSSVSGSAKIKPDIQVKVSAKVSGKIMKLGVEEGDYVKKGQFLAQLDQANYKAAADQARSNLNYSLAGYQKSKSEYERAETLFSNNLISKSELEISKSSYKQAKAQVEQSRAALNRAEDDLSKTTIYSSMEGTVSKLNKKEGEMAMGSQFTLDVLMVISDLTRMVAETEIDENDVIYISEGDTAEINLDAYPDTLFKGIVTEIANTGETTGAGTQGEVTNFFVKAAMLEKPEGIRPGMSATVDILTETHFNILKVPIQCITVRKPVGPESEDKKEQKNKSEDAEKQENESEENEELAKISVDSEKIEEKEAIEVVFVVKDEIAHQVPVKTGISNDTEWELLKGVEEGDEVISGSFKILSKQISDGDKVKIDNSLKDKYNK